MTLVSNWADFSNAMKPAYLLTINGNQWLTVMNESILDLMGNTGFVFHSDPYTSIEFNYHNETTNASQLHVKGWAEHCSFILSFSSAPWGQGLIFVHCCVLSQPSYHPQDNQMALLVGAVIIYHLNCAGGQIQVQLLLLSKDIRKSSMSWSLHSWHE